MAKKVDKLKLDDFDLDEDLDFDNFDFDEINNQKSADAKNTRKRSPVMDVFKGTISGAKDKFKEPSFLAKVVKETLPEQYGSVFSKADDVAGTVSSLYDDAIREIKPQLARLSKKVDKLVPAEQKFFKKITSKFSNMFGDETSAYKGQDKGALENQTITNSLAQIFEAQTQMDNDVRAREAAKQDVTSTIETKRFTSNFGLLSSIDSNISRLSVYNDKVTQAYQKKTLELQFRSYFVQNELLQTSSKFFEIFKNQNEAITKNTALPEFVKIKNSERFKELGYRKFNDAAHNALFNNDFIGKFKERITKKYNEKKASIKDAIEKGIESADGIETMRDMTADMADAGITTPSGSEMAGNVIGGGVLEHYAAKLFKSLRDKQNKIYNEKDPAKKGLIHELVRGIGNIGYKAKNITDNLSGEAAERSKGFNEDMFSGGIKGLIAEAAKFFLDAGAADRPNLKIEANKGGIGNLSQPALFDNKVHKSITEVIPGYLARIYREINITRTGNINAKVNEFDFTSGKFKPAKELSSDIRQILKETAKSSSYGYFSDRLHKLVTGGEKLEGRDEKKVKDFFSDLSTLPSMKYTPENIKNTEIFKKLDPKTAKLIEDQLDKLITNSDNKEQGQSYLTKGIVNLRETTPDIRAKLEELAQAGHGDILEKQGFIKRDKTGNFDIDLKALTEFNKATSITVGEEEKNLAAHLKIVEAEKKKKKEAKDANRKAWEDEIDPVTGRRRGDSDINIKRNINLFKGRNKKDDDTIATSDINAKRNISPADTDISPTKSGSKFSNVLKPKNALAAIRKTKIYNWLYKQGKGDQDPKTGPMAQDVKANMGDQVAPDGKKLDLINLNGVNMSAIKELENKVDGQQNKISAGGDKSIEILSGIKSDTASILDHIKNNTQSSTGGGFSMEGVKDKAAGYKDLLKNSIQSSTDLILKAGGDLFSGVSKIFTFGKDKVAKPAADMLASAYTNNKDKVGNVFKTMFTKAGEMAVSVLDIGKDVIFNKLPAGYKQLAGLALKAKDKIKELLQGPVDVYIKGKIEPVLKANLMRMGGYYDQVTGKVIKSIEDIKGAVVDHAGNVVLTIEDAGNGLVDKYGKPLLPFMTKLAQAAIAHIGKGINRASKFFKAALSTSTKVGGSILGNIKDRFNKGKEAISSSGGISGGKSYDVLVEIRNLLDKKFNPRKNRGNKTEQSNTETSSGQPTGGTGSLFSSVKNKVTGIKDKLLGKSKDESGDKKTSISEKFNTYKQKVLDTAKRTKEAFEARMAKTASSGTTSGSVDDRASKLDELKQANQNGPAEADMSAKYRGGGNIIDTIMNKGKGLLTGAASTIGNIKAGLPAIKSAKGIKGKGLALIGSLFSKGKTPDGAAPELVGPPKPEVMGPPKPADQKPKTLAQKAKDLLVSGKDKIQNIKKRIVDKTKATFNDRDGSGTRDGSVADREEKIAALKNAKQNGAAAVNLTPQYRSEKNVIDTMMEKFGGLLGMFTSGASGLFGKAGDLFSTVTDFLSISGKGGILKGAAKLLGKTGGLIGKGGKAIVAGGGKLLGMGSKVAAGAGAVGGAGILSKLGTAGKAIGSGAGKLLGMGGKVAAGAAGTVGSGALGAAKAVGSGVFGKLGGKLLPGLGTALGAYSAFDNLNKGNYGSAAFDVALTGGAALLAGVSLPVVLSVAAVAAVGYGLYRGVKYLGKNSADDFEKIRLMQYGFNDKSTNHASEILALENYLQSDVVVYERGVASLSSKRFDIDKVLNIFSLDKEDKEKIDKLNYWMQGRFKPFFLNTLTSLFAVNNKAKLSDIKSLKDAELVKFLDLCKFESGPYSYSDSPFTDNESLFTDKGAILTAIKNFSKKASDKIASKPSDKKNATDKDFANKDAAKPIAKPENTMPGAAPVALPKTNIASDKNKSTASGPTGEDGVVKQPITDKNSVIGTANVGKLAQATGPIRDGKSGMQYIILQPGVNINEVNPSLLNNFKGMAQEYGELTGKTLTVNSAARSREEQEALYRKDPKRAAKPGNSLHEFGLALDVNSADLAELERLGLMRKYGFTRPVGGEPWHTEPAGIQVNPTKAKADSSFAMQAIEASLFKGGGGVGIMSNSEKGRRNTELAIGLLTASSTSIDPTAMSDKDKAVSTIAMKQQPTDTATKKPVLAAVPTTAKPTYSAADANIKQAETYSKTNKLTPTLSVVKNPDVDSKPYQTDITTANAGVKDPGNKEEVKQAITNIAKKSGTDPNMMTAFAAVESSLNPNAKSNASSASGLFQFTKTTWDEQLSKHGGKYNLDKNVGPNDINASTLLASEYIKSNTKFLQSVKANPNLTDIYLTHLLGASGARSILSADPSEIAAKVSPAAAKSNPELFYQNNRALTVGEFYTNVEAKLNRTAKQYNIPLPSMGDIGFGNQNQSKPSSNDVNTATKQVDKPAIGSTATPSFNSNPAVKGDGIASMYSKASKPTIYDSLNSGSQLPTSEPIKSTGLFTGNKSNIISQGTNSGNQSQGSGFDNLIPGINTVNDTMLKSVGIQEQMLSVLKDILTNVNPENLNAFKQKLEKPAKDGGYENKTQRLQTTTVPQPAVELRRRAV